MTVCLRDANSGRIVPIVGYPLSPKLKNLQAHFRMGLFFSPNWQLNHSIHTRASLLRHGTTNATCTTGGYDQVYDAENRLTSITVGPNTTTYVYDGAGDRVKKTEGNNVTRNWEICMR